MGTSTFQGFGPGAVNYIVSITLVLSLRVEGFMKPKRGPHVRANQTRIGFVIVVEGDIFWQQAARSEGQVDGELSTPGKWCLCECGGKMFG
jgi:hypothetical protein